MQELSSSAGQSTHVGAKSGYCLLTGIHQAIPESRSWETTEVDRLVRHSVFTEIPAETIIMESNTICEQFIILLEGTVRVYQADKDGREFTFYRVSPGDICVLSLNSLLKGQKFSAIAESETRLRAVSVDKRFFLGLLARNESFAERILGCLTGHFCKTMALVEDLVFQGLESRLVCLLGNLFEANGGRAIRASHQELANELGSTREVVSRLLKSLERDGCISLLRREIRLSLPNHLLWQRRNQ